jgi:ATP-dependent DNA helicase DinG
LQAHVPSELELLLIPGAEPSIRARYASLSARAEDFVLGVEAAPKTEAQAAEPSTEAKFSAEVKSGAEVKPSATPEPEFIILDTETTGFSAAKDALIEVAAACVCGKEIRSTFSTFVNPGRPIPRRITEITSISNADVAKAPSADEVMRELIAFCGHRPVVAHNASFDQAFIQANCEGLAMAEHVSFSPPFWPVSESKEQSCQLPVWIPGQARNDGQSLTRDDEPASELTPDSAGPVDTPPPADSAAPADTPAPANTPPPAASEPTPAPADTSDPVAPSAPASTSDPAGAAPLPPLLSPEPWIDTVELARIALPLLREHNLESLSGAFAPDVRSTHRAIDDVLALAKVWRVILVALSDLPVGLCAYLAGIFPNEAWSSRPVLALIAQSTATTAASDTPAPATRDNQAPATPNKPAPRGTFDIAAVRELLTRHLREQHKVDAEELDGGVLALKPVEPDELVGEYTPSGLLGMMYPEYEARAEQLQMATAVATALNTGGFATIEAGTGVGKSMAYLLPAALFARRNGITCGIATKSNALLDQLMYHELPRLSTALAAQGAGGLEYLSLKGYEHYPCLRKLLRLTPQSRLYKGHAALVAHLLSYACQSVLGDIDAIKVRRGEVPRFEYLASADDCLGYRCRYYRCCLLHSMRRQAKNADIIVTNHALLYCDVTSGGSLLPPVRHWVIDEAHSAEGEARRQLSRELEARTLAESVHAIRKGGGLLERIRTDAASKADGGVVLALASKAGEAAEPTDALASSFFSAIADLANLGEKSDYNQLELWLSARVRESGEWGEVMATGRALGARMEKLVASLKNLIAALGELPDMAEQQSALAGHTMTIAAAVDTLSLILNGTDPAYVYSAQLDRRAQLNANKLVASYYDMGEVLAEEFYPNQLSVVYTSATIALALPAAPDEFGNKTSTADFSYFKRGVGLDLLDAGRVSTLKLDSSYDFDTNMTVFVPLNMLAPNDYDRRNEYLAQLDELLFQAHKALGGSVLTLFTNRREMEEAYERLHGAFEANALKVVCQFAGTSRTRLRERFIADQQLSLFALRSFWEGFDAPGDTLRCVVIPKLPFGRPNDPLQKEREQREQRAWNNYVLPEAVISLKQAAGRLIRSGSDWGYLLLADARLVSKFYGKQFLAALPSQNIHYLSLEGIAKRMREGSS